MKCNRLPHPGGPAARGAAACVLAMLLALPTVSQAALIQGFQNITGNSAANAATGESQLTVEISDALGGMNLGDHQALFTFRNAGPNDSSITQIYFDDGTLLGIASIINSTGTDFEQPTTGQNTLPGGNTLSPPFESTADFRAFPDQPVQPNGVNPGEQVAILFDLLSGVTLGHTIAAIGTDALRIGIHVQGYGDGGSESFVNRDPPQIIPPASVPAPASFALLAAGLLATGFAARARRRRVLRRQG